MTNGSISGQPASPTAVSRGECTRCLPILPLVYPRQMGPRGSLHNDLGSIFSHLPTATTRSISRASLRYTLLHFFPLPLPRSLSPFFQLNPFPCYYNPLASSPLLPERSPNSLCLYCWRKPPVRNIGPLDSQWVAASVLEHQFLNFSTERR